MTISRIKIILTPIIAACAFCLGAMDLEDLLNPDAAILRQNPQPAKPAPVAKPVEVKPAEVKPVEVKPAEVKPVEVKPAEPVVEKPATGTLQEDQRKMQEDQRKLKEEQQRLQAERDRQQAELQRIQDELRRQREAAAAKEAASREERETRVKAEAASRKELEAQRKELEKQRDALEAQLKSAEEARKAAEKKAAEAEAARLKSEEEIGDVAKKALAERKAREEAETARRAAEQRAENERRAAEKAVADKAIVEKRLNYLMNPDPDERADAKKTDVKKEAAKSEAKNVKGDDGRKVGDEKKEVKRTPAKAGAGKPPQKKALTGREAVITAERTDYDRKEGVILFDRNVHVDDEQYQMHADRLFVFLDGTNELKRLVAIGHVAITNDEKTAYCARATYSKATGKVVMYSNDEIKSRLHENGKKGSTVVGDRITFWVNSEQVEVENPVISMPGGALKGGDAKDILKGGMLGGEKQAQKKKENAPNANKEEPTADGKAKGGDK